MHMCVNGSGIYGYLWDRVQVCMYVCMCMFIV